MTVTKQYQEQTFLASVTASTMAGPSMPDSMCAKDGQEKELTNCWVFLIYSMIQHYSSQSMFLNCGLVIMLISSLILTGNEGFFI